jgi:cytochrome c biogenesis protein CcmG/thiol:disulfide interchange protein DsbE
METPSVEIAEQTGRKRPAGWIAAGVIGVLILALLIYGLAGRASARLQPGDPAPEFELAALDGGTLSLAQAAGKVLVVNFFASWCDPCRSEAPALEQVWREYEPQGVQFYGIAYKDAAPKAQAFLEQFKLNYPSGSDPRSTIARSYGVTGVPETFVIDKQGRLVHQFVGEVTAEDLREKIDAALGAP